MQRLLLVLAVLLVGGQATPAKYWPGPSSTLLRYRFKEGEKLRCTIERKGVVAITLAANKERASGTHQDMDLVLTVAEVRDGVARISFKFERLRLFMDVDGVKSRLDFDSRNAQQNP